MAKSDRETGRLAKEAINPLLQGTPSSEDAFSEVMSDLVLRGRVCAGCQSSIGMSPNLEYAGVECFCKDELTPYLADAHDGLRWCNEDCLYNTHEDPTWPDLEELRWHV